MLKDGYHIARPSNYSSHFNTKYGNAIISHKHKNGQSVKEKEKALCSNEEDT